MRRALPFLLLVAILAALGIGAAVSAGDDSEKEAAADRAAALSQTVAHRKAARLHGRGGHGHGMLRLLADQVLTSGAQRLDVDKSVLRKAVRATAKGAFARHFRAAGVTEGERANLRACKIAFHRRAARRAAGCDRSAAKATMRKLHAAGLPDVAEEKTLLSAELAKRLGKTSEEVLGAARAELELRLGQAVALGVVTSKGRELALGCFDAPASCDLRALRREISLRHP